MTKAQALRITTRRAEAMYATGHTAETVRPVLAALAATLTTPAKAATALAEARDADDAATVAAYELAFAETVRCTECGRALTSDTSVARGIGPECATAA